MKKLLALSVLLLFVAGIVSCGNYERAENDRSLNDQNSRAYMEVRAEIVDPFEPDPNPSIDKCWAENNGQCCYATGMVASCNDLGGGVECEGDSTGSAEGEEGCAALADEYAEAQD